MKFAGYRHGNCITLYIPSSIPKHHTTMIERRTLASITERSNGRPHHMNVLSHESELQFGSEWDSSAMRELIRSKCSLGETPSFLFLGKAEAELLKAHLTIAFGEDAVPTLRGTYYMGLEVILVEPASFVYVGGRKTTRTLQDPIARRPAWREGITDSMWQLQLD